jgi:hypothetical protein
MALLVGALLAFAALAVLEFVLASQTSCSGLRTEKPHDRSAECDLNVVLCHE